MTTDKKVLEGGDGADAGRFTVEDGDLEIVNDPREEGDKVLPALDSIRRSCALLEKRVDALAKHDAEIAWTKLGNGMTVLGKVRDGQTSARTFSNRAQAAAAAAASGGTLWQSPASRIFFVRRDAARKDTKGALAKHDGTDGERTIPVRAEQLRKGDKIFDHTYGYVVIESVRPFDPKYKNSLLVETSRGRRDFGPPDRILHVLRNS